MPSVPDSARPEDKAICELVNNGMSSQHLYKAAYTFYKYELEQRLCQGGKIKVVSGLFKGLVLYPGSIASALLPKALGTYEKEVQDYLQEHEHHFEKFLNIGCAEGFYLSGIAKWKKIACMGVDIDARSEDAVGFASANNDVSDLVSFSTALHSAENFLSGSLLCMVDVDGAELEIIDQLNLLFQSSSLLKSVRLIVESDRSQLGRQNTPEIISLLCASGWNVERTIKQDPKHRFVDFCSEFSFLEQVVRGAEGRPGGQCWIVSSKTFN